MSSCPLLLLYFFTNLFIGSSDSPITHPSVHLSMLLPICPSIYMYFCNHLFIYPFFYPSDHESVFIHPSVYPFVSYQSIYRAVYLLVYSSVHLNFHSRPILDQSQFFAFVRLSVSLPPNFVPKNCAFLDCKPFARKCLNYSLAYESTAAKEWSDEFNHHYLMPP